MTLMLYTSLADNQDNNAQQIFLVSNLFSSSMKLAPYMLYKSSTF